MIASIGSRLRTLWSSALLELLLLVPVWLALSAWFTEAPMQLLLGVSGCAASLLGAAFALRKVRRWQQLLYALAVGGVVAAFMIGSGAFASGASTEGLSPELSAALYAATGGLVVFFAALQGATTGGRIGTTGRLWYGLALYFAAAIVFPLVGVLQNTVAALTVCGVISLIISLFASNIVFLRSAAYAANPGKAIPGPLRRINRLMMAVVLLVAVGLTALFGNAFGKLLYAMIRWLFSLLPQGSEEPPPPEPEQPRPPAQDMLPIPEEEPGLLADILNILFYVVSGLLIMAILAWVGVMIYRHAGGKLRELLHRLASFLTRSGRTVDEAAYVDEETTVFSWEAVGRRMKETWLGRMLSRARAERWEDQRTNVERVRYLYRRWLRSAVERGYEYHRYLTPRETEADVETWTASQPAGRGAGKAARRAEQPAGGAEDLVELYDRVRYGGPEPSDAELERIRRLSEK